MSKNSAKQRYTQLMEWLEVRSKGKVNSNNSVKSSTGSRMEYSKERGRK